MLTEVLHQKQCLLYSIPIQIIVDKKKENEDGRIINVNCSHYANPPATPYNQTGSYKPDLNIS